MSKRNIITYSINNKLFAHLSRGNFIFPFNIHLHSKPRIIYKLKLPNNKLYD